MRPDMDYNLKVIEHPVSTAIRGLLEQRIQIVKMRDHLLGNVLWRRFQEFWDIYTKEIENIDKQLEILYNMVEKGKE